MSKSASIDGVKDVLCLLAALLAALLAPFGSRSAVVAMLSLRRVPIHAVGGRVRRFLGELVRSESNEVYREILEEVGWPVEL